MRALDIRLKEYAGGLRETAAGIMTVVQQVEAVRQDVNPETQGLRDTAKMYTLVADDLDVILTGRELQRWMIEVEL